MTQDTKLTHELNTAEPTNETDVVTVLATWSATLRDILDTRTPKAYRDTFWEHCEEVSTLLVDCVKFHNTPWEFLRELRETYPPTGNHLAHTPLVNAVGAQLMATRSITDISDVPQDALTYLQDIGRINPSDTAWEDAFALGWGIDHPDFHPCEYADDLLGEPREHFLSGILKTAWQTDQQEALKLTKHCITSRKTVETLIWLQPVDAISQMKSRPPRYSPIYISPKETINDNIADELLEFCRGQGLMNGIKHHKLLTSIRLH